MLKPRTTASARRRRPYIGHATAVATATRVPSSLGIPTTTTSSSSTFGANPPNLCPQIHHPHSLKACHNSRVHPNSAETLKSHPLTTWKRDTTAYAPTQLPNQTGCNKRHHDRSGLQRLGGCTQRDYWRLMNPQGTDSRRCVSKDMFR